MSLRVPLPNRRQLQTLSGLTQALKYHLNVASNAIITDDSALGYINAAEDIDLTPLKSFFMKRSEFITVDSTGTFKVKDLKYPATEIVGVFYQFDDLYNQNEYLQYVDPVTFGKGYGTVFTDAIYTVTTSTDGTNDQVIQTYPAPPSALIGIEYYCDWPKLGDLTTASTLQQIRLNISGTATTNGNLTFTCTIGGVTTLPVSIPVVIGDTAAVIANKIITANSLPFQTGEGNNTTRWYATLVTGTTNVLLTSPTYTELSATLNIVATPLGVSITQTAVQPPFVQTVQTNWFLYQYPYMYYYAALKHAYNGFDDAERLALVEKEFLKSVQVFQAFTDRAEWGGVHRQPDYNQNVVW